MYSDMSKRMSAWSLPNSKLASARASSVLPTPVGPRKMKLPTGRFRFFRPARDRRIAREIAEMQRELEEAVAACVQIRRTPVHGFVHDGLTARRRDDRRHAPLGQVLIDAAGLVEAPKRGFVAMDHVAALGVV